ncbi:MAG: alpha/beta hydrolase, partial [Bacteroidota bacterium]
MKTIQAFFLLLLFSLPFGVQSQANMTTTSESSTLRAGENRVTFQSGGESIVGTLFLPDGFREGSALTTVIISGPWTQVKEQVGYRYAEALRQRGLAALAIDHRYWGESGGTPRALESGAAKVEDLRNAITFLSTLPAINAEDINLVGVCAGAGTTAQVVAQDIRVAGYATVAAWLQHPSTTPLFYGGDEGVAALIAKGEAAEATYANTGEMPYVAAYDPAEGSGAAMSFPSEYYGRADRGAVPSWTNQFAVTSWK